MHSQSMPRLVAALRKPATWGVVLATVAFVLTVVLAVLSSQPEPNPVSVSMLLVTLAGVVQFGSARLFHSVGRADPGLARSSVRRLMQMGQRAAQAEEEVQAAFESDDSLQQRVALGRVSVHLSHFQDEVTAQTQDWLQFHRDALEEVVRRDSAEPLSPNGSGFNE